MTSRLLAAVLSALVSLGFPAIAVAQDAESGEKIFNRCKACHMVGEGAKNRTGPHLNGLFGRTAGTLEGTKYSNSMIAMGEDGLVWDDETLDQFLTSPRDFVKGTRMSFPGLKDAEDRADLIEYLREVTAVEDEEAAS